MIFLMIWPFYHHALLRFSIEDLKRYVLIIFTIWSLPTLIPFANLGANNLLAFLMLYAAVVLIKRLKIVFDNYRKVFFGFMLIPYALAVLSMIALDLLGKRIPAAAEYSCYFMRGNYRPVSMMVSIGLFMWGTSWQVRTNRVIDYLADATFGVYLFHMYPPIMKILFEQIFLIQNVIDKPFAVLWLVAITVVIFLAGALIDIVRKVLFYTCDLLINQIRAKNNLST